MTIKLPDLPHAVNTYLETSTRISTKLALLRRRRSPVRRAGVRRRALAKARGGGGYTNSLGS